MMRWLVFAALLPFACSSSVDSPKGSGGFGGAVDIGDVGGGAAGIGGSAGAPVDNAGAAGMSDGGAGGEAAGSGGDAAAGSAEAGSAGETSASGGSGGHSALWAACNPGECELVAPVETCGAWAPKAGDPVAYLCTFGCWSLQPQGQGKPPKMAPDAALVERCTGLGGLCLGAGDSYPVCVPHAPT